MTQEVHDYFYDNHEIMLLESDWNDILSLARQEIELPTEREIWEEYKKRSENLEARIEKIRFCHAFMDGAYWLRDKVKNPYPKTI